MIICIDPTMHTVLSRGEDERSKPEAMLRECDEGIGSQRATLDHNTIIDTEEGINIIHAISVC